MLDRLDAMRLRLEETDDPEQAIELLQELADLDKEVQAELRRAREAAETDAAGA
jgi:hypothetical protein